MKQGKITVEHHIAIGGGFMLNRDQQCGKSSKACHDT
jgi:hypothetical protein